jgi:hypothetical protein
MNRMMVFAPVKVKRSELRYYSVVTARPRYNTQNSNRYCVQTTHFWKTGIQGCFTNSFTIAMIPTWFITL